MEETIAQITARVDDLEKMTQCALGLAISIFVAFFALGFFFLGRLVSDTKGKE